MLKKIEWHSQIGRRLHLRQLHVFSVVAERGSMAKAATQLGVSTPTVSEIIADLEHAVGVRLLDRGPRGIEPTSSGRALLGRTHVVFDELSHAIQDIELLADPPGGAGARCRVYVALDTHQLTSPLWSPAGGPPRRRSGRGWGCLSL